MPLAEICSHRVPPDLEQGDWNRMTGTRTRRRLERKPHAPAVPLEARRCLLLALLRESKRAESLTEVEGRNILDHVCVLRPTLTASELKEVGNALKKVSGAQLQDSEDDYPT